MKEQTDDGRDGLVVLGFHQAMVVKLTSNLPIPLGKVACKSGDLSAARLINMNLLVLTNQNITKSKRSRHPQPSSSSAAAVVCRRRHRSSAVSSIPLPPKVNVVYRPIH